MLQRSTKCTGYIHSMTKLSTVALYFLLCSKQYNMTVNFNNVTNLNTVKLQIIPLQPAMSP